MPESSFTGALLAQKRTFRRKEQMTKKEIIKKLEELESKVNKQSVWPVLYDRRLDKFESIASCPKHEFGFVQKETIDGWIQTLGIAYYSGQPHTIYHFKCKCGFEKSKTKEDLTAKEKKALGDLGLL